MYLIDSVFRTGNNYYPQVSLEEYKHVAKEKKLPEYITDDIEFLMILIGKILMKKLLMKKVRYIDFSLLIKYKLFSLYIKMANIYYQINNEELRKEARERCQKHKESIRKKHVKNTKIFLKKKKKKSRKKTQEKH